MNTHATNRQKKIFISNTVSRLIHETAAAAAKSAIAGKDTLKIIISIHIAIVVLEGAAFEWTISFAACEIKKNHPSYSSSSFPSIAERSRLQNKLRNSSRICYDCFACKITSVTLIITTIAACSDHGMSKSLGWSWSSKKIRPRSCLLLHPWISDCAQGSRRSRDLVPDVARVSFFPLLLLFFRIYNTTPLQ